MENVECERCADYDAIRVELEQWKTETHVRKCAYEEVYAELQDLRRCNRHQQKTIKDGTFLAIERLKVEIARLQGLLKDHEEDWKRIQDAERENERLKRIIAQELSENDELGCEFVYVNILKEENARYRKALEKILNAGNMATQGKWDATDEMKTIAYKVLEQKA